MKCPNYKRLSSLWHNSGWVLVILGYNTNGFAHHRLEDTLPILASLGYKGVAITLDYHSLNPFAADLPRQLSEVKTALEKHSLRSVIETGARFLLDPLHKHQPTLLSSDSAHRERRVDFLHRAIDIAGELESDAVSFWSGSAGENDRDKNLMSRLAEGCKRLCSHAESKRIRLAFEPEPGMLVDRMDRFAELAGLVNHPSFGLTIDVGHLHCQGEIPISDHLRRWRQLLFNVHIEDMRKGIHDHLMFGDGEIDFRPVFETLHQIGYTGGVYIELSRHSHNAVETARNALAFLKATGCPV